MSFDEHEERCNEFGREQALKRAPQGSPRPWEQLVAAWVAMVHKLAAIVGAPPWELDGNWLAARDGRAVALTTWRWMWSLQPCSEARKSAFTLGAAALWIERWRLQERACVACGIAHASTVHKHDASVGQRAERDLRIAAWHIDDARGEAQGRTLGVKPTIPPHERVYERTPDGLRVHGDACAREDMPRIVLSDHAGWRKLDLHHVLSAEHMFTELAIASLPDGHWVMTSRDADRFLDLILEDGGDGITRVHVAEPGLRGTIADPQMLFADPPDESEPDPTNEKRIVHPTEEP